MNGNLCPRSQSVSSGGVVQLGSTASATSVPSASVYSIHRHPANIGHIQHSQSQQWQSVGGGGGVNGATASLGGGDAGGATFIVRRQSSRQQDGGVQRRVRLPPSGAWMERVFQRRDCIKFIPADDHSDRFLLSLKPLLTVFISCQCGRVSASHSQLALSRFTTSVVVRRGTDGGDTPADGPYDEEARWTIGGCTAPSPTDAYGVIQFQGGPHVHKARYVRLSFDSEPADVLRLMVREWDLSMPRLVISVQGGMTDFELNLRSNPCIINLTVRVPAKLGKVFREGLLKAAETTGAWVITAGVDSGVVKHVAKALDEAGISPRMRSRIVTVGIAPWGLLQRRERLVGRNAQVPYDRHSASPSSARRCSSGASSSPSGGLVLNDRHSYFLLADNGTVGRYGADIVLRKRLEEFLASRTEKKVYGGRRTATATESSSCSRIPIVCVVLEGGLCTLNPVHRYLTGTPSIPVIICEGSGRISDIVTVPIDVHAQLLCQVRQLTCHSGLHDQMNSSDAIVDRIVQCARNRDGLLTIFRLNNGMQNSDVPSQMDHAILRALLQAQNLSPVDQLLMTLAWGREDIARREIFRQGHKRPGDGHQQMDSALLGLSLKRFLTIDCLERLYNAECAMDALMKNGRRGAERRRSSGRRRKRRQTVTLPEIGVAIE
uniref:LSDAT_euk domain-containing protein n=1 Tax=Globodera pallida TaxID=36090 RepID=A0A183CP46_GLOPA